MSIPHYFQVNMFLHYQLFLYKIEATLEIPESMKADIFLQRSVIAVVTGNFEYSVYTYGNSLKQIAVHFDYVCLQITEKLFN